MMKRAIVTACAAAALLCAAAAWGEEKPDAAKARAEAIAGTLKAIDQELAAHGGSFEAWGKSVQPFRDDLKAKWSTKDNFRFIGQDASVIQIDGFDGRPEGKRPFDAIVAFDKQLRARGIDLIFMPLPDKLAIYPDKVVVSDGAAGRPARVPADRMVCVSVKHLMKRLLEAGVEVVDLYTLFRDWRLKNPDKPLYYNRDSHWRNLAAQIAGEKLAERLNRYDFVTKALAGGNRYTVKPEYRADKPDDILTVREAKSGAYYRDDPRSPVLLTGDSNTMYNMSNQIAHLPAQVARHVGMPLAFVAPTFGDAPVKLKSHLAGRRVILWTPIARGLAGPWPVVDLGAAPSGGK